MVRVAIRLVFVILFAIALIAASNLTPSAIVRQAHSSRGRCFLCGDLEAELKRLNGGFPLTTNQQKLVL